MSSKNNQGFTITGIFFSIAGLLGVFINLFLVWFLATLFGYIFLFSIIGLTIGQTSNFILQKIIVFKSKKNPIEELPLYSIGVIIGYIFNLTTVYYLVYYFDIYYLFSHIAGILAGTAINYTFQYFITFKKTIKSP